ncbi:TIGR04211 family SH3 domain-containing protein [Thalassotalea crassostreae]|uniref:TIGR04211 family SH3 domain-containing protein n=1 Tax=Thalassotalea crassostreae TaxID=1763536 RepID=UPI000837F282|nr:TIGR04211 family SH3 domain-containing protein [Thalassotalea crassostreae]
MKTLATLLGIFILIFSFGTSFGVSAEQSENKTGFISDDLFIYFHSGPGTEYRILGSINAGEEVQVLSAVERGYVQVKDNKGREGWIDNNYLNDSAGMRVALVELNAELADKNNQISQLREELASATTSLNETKQQYSELSKAKDELSVEHLKVSEQLDDQDFQTQKTYFIYGASVLVIGLILGLILPAMTRRRNSNSSWS